MGDASTRSAGDPRTTDSTNSSGTTDSTGPSDGGLPTEDAGPGRIIGHRPIPTRRMQAWSAVITVSWLVLVGFMVMAKGPFGLLWLAVPSAILVQVVLRPPTVVDRSGIQRRWRRPPAFFWPQVRGVAAPQHGVPMVRLILTSGRPVDLEDIAAEHSGAVAALGDKEVLAPPRRTPPAPRGGEIGDEQRELDVERRAARLAAERAEMRAGEPRDR